MTCLSYKLAKAAAAGRAQWRPVSREQILARLLMKRAAAYRAGLGELEEQLRAQIAWSLPIRHDPDAALSDAWQSHRSPQSATKDEPSRNSSTP